MSCSSSTIGRLRRDGPDDHAVAGGRGPPRHRRARRSTTRATAPAMLRGRNEHRRAHRRLAGRGLCRSPMSARQSPASGLVLVAPLDGEIVIVRNATSAFVGTDLEARLDELGATTLVLCGALDDRMRSRRRRGTPAISAISCLSSPTRAGRPTRPISEAGSGRRRTCGRCRWRTSRARPRPSSTSRRRSEPRRRPRRASAARREGSLTPSDRL